MRVCHLVHHLANGGLEQQVYELVRYGSEEVDYTVCYLDEDDSLAADIRSVGGTVVDLDIGGAGRMAVFDPRAVRTVAAFLRGREFDLLHVHSPLYVHVIGRLASAYAGPEYIVGTYHNRPGNFHLVMRYLERATRALTSVNVGVSKAVERAYTGGEGRYISGEKPGRSCTIHNGIDVTAFTERVNAADARSIRESHNLDEECVFLNVGRYAPQKAQTDLIRAMSRVVEAVPKSHLFVVGWGPLEKELRQSVREHGLENHVSITGKVPTVEEYYAAADVFVLSSVWEGLPIVVLEAMAARLPLIATDVSGVPEVVANGETGRLVPPEAPEKLATEMIEMTSEDKREDFGSAGYNRVSERFDIQRTSELYLSLYRSLIKAE